jgi:hypothetical protein
MFFGDASVLEGDHVMGHNFTNALKLLNYAS